MSRLASTCAYRERNGDTICSTLSLVLVPPFDDRLQDFFWQYDNSGLKLAQVRLYEVPTNTN